MNPKFPRVAKALESLKLRLTLAGSLALALGIGSSVAVLLHKAARDTVSESRQDEVVEAVRAASHLQRRMVGQQRALTVAARRLTPSVLENENALRDFLEANAVLREEVSSLWITDRGGKILLLADPSGIRASDIDMSRRGYFRRAVEQANPTISETIISRVSIEPAVFMAQPLIADDAVFGVLGATLRLKSQDLMAGIADTVQEGDSVLVTVTDSSGVILAHPERSKVGSRIENEPRLVKSFERWTEVGKPIEPAGLEFHDDERIVVAAGVPGPDWIVWRSRDTQEVLAPLTAGRMQAVNWAIGIVVGLAALLSACLWWLLQPLSRLERRAAHLFDGSLDADEGWTAAPGEVGSLQRVLRRVASERAELEALNGQVLSRLQSVMTTAPIGIAFTRAARFELVSAEFCRLLGREESEMLGQSTDLVLPSADRAAALREDARLAFAQKRAYAGEVRARHADGHLFWARLSARPVDPDDLEAGTIWTARNVDAEVASRDALEWSASHDTLTGLGNRRDFQSRIDHVFGARPRSMPAALVVFDLDRLKPINDSEGHAAGDAVLKAVARAATDAVRSGDLVVRLGGDEFAVVLERCPQEAALRIAESVRTAIGAIGLPWAERVLSVGASVGVAVLSEEMPTPEAWVAEADRACYAAKAAGRNAVRLAA